MYQKKKKRLWIWVALLLLVIVAGGSYTYYRNEQLLAATETSAGEEIVLGENQTLCYVRIDKILGNEMSGTILEDDGVNTMETDTWTIPVGTDVVTKLGTTTTFARLSGGDTIKMLMQRMGDGSEEILKIWITDLTDKVESDMSGDMQGGVPGNMRGGMPQDGNGGFPGGE